MRRRAFRNFHKKKQQINTEDGRKERKKRRQFIFIDEARCVRRVKKASENAMMTARGPLSTVWETQLWVSAPTKSAQKPTGKPITTQRRATIVSEKKS